MSYSFTTDLFGLTVLVTGEFSPEEAQTFDYPGCSAEFNIEEIEHKGEQLEIDSLPDGELREIVKAAFESASNAAQDCADERASERAEERRQE
jgi:hypothetical protein